MPRHFLGLQEIFMRPLAVILILCASPLNNLLAQSASFDLVIRNGRIIDGTGSPWYSGDVGIRGGERPQRSRSPRAEPEARGRIPMPRA